MKKWKKDLLWGVDKETVTWLIQRIADSYEQSLEDWEIPIAMYFGAMNFRLLTGIKIGKFAEFQKTVKELGLDDLLRGEKLGA